MPVNYKKWLYPLVTKSIFLLVFVCLFNFLGGLQVFGGKLYILNRIEQFIYIPTLKHSIVEFVSSTLLYTLISSILITFLCTTITLNKLHKIVLLTNLLLTILFSLYVKDTYQLLLVSTGFILLLTYIGMIIPSIFVFKYYEVKNTKIISLSNVITSLLSIVIASVIIYFIFHNVLVALINYIHL
ncbi:hypothetical protein DM558_11195 [Entomomonas moraniae]|uniref:Uncharacterized protein n=1 Tax=Entomomonas moraniae TaxID=2213226 RepID=A0A3Q9JMY7_9GAMM|nr:hypothetical protein DM558_11195 [Entomomonas moraniae]